MPKIVDKDKKRAEIANAAIDIFANKGFENATIQEIAKAAHIGKGTVYEYFKSKEEILIFLSNNILKLMNNMASAALSNSKNPKEKLIFFVKELLGHAIDMKYVREIHIIYIDIWRINLRDKKYGLTIELLYECVKGMRKMISDIIDEGKKKGVFKKNVDSDSVAISLIAAFDGIHFHYLFNDTSFDLMKVSNEFINTCLNGILI